MKKEKIYIFDAYGTLLDIDSACRNLSKYIGDDWITLTKIWRQKQLEYSWLRNAMNCYISFWEITKDALSYAMKSLGLEDNDLKEKLLNLYFNIESYSEVKGFLEELKKNKCKICILSNGSTNMLKSGLKSSKLEKFMDKVLSVDTCKRFKPSKEVYQMVKNEYKEDKNKYIFFSSNCWDIHGASNFGFETVWVNRFNKINDYLPGKPDLEIKNLRDYKINT